MSDRSRINFRFASMYKFCAFRNQFTFQIQGNLALASVTQVLIGCTGFVGILLKFIGPLTIAPTIALIGLSLAENVVDFSSKHWGIAAL